MKCGSNWYAGEKSKCRANLDDSKICNFNYLKLIIFCFMVFPMALHRYSEDAIADRVLLCIWEKNSRLYPRSKFLREKYAHNLDAAQF